MTVKELRKALKKFRNSEMVFFPISPGTMEPVPVQTVQLKRLTKNGHISHKEPSKRSRIVLIG